MKKHEVNPICALCENPIDPNGLYFIYPTQECVGTLKAGKLKYRDILGTYHPDCWLGGDGYEDLPESIPYLLSAINYTLRNYRVNTLLPNLPVFTRQIIRHVSKSHTVLGEELKALTLAVEHQEQQEQQEEQRKLNHTGKKLELLPENLEVAEK